MGEGSRVPSRQHPLVFVWSWQMYVCPKREISRWCRFSDLRISSPEKLKSELANKMKFPPALAPYPEIFISYDLNKRGATRAGRNVADHFEAFSGNCVKWPRRRLFESAVSWTPLDRKISSSLVSSQLSPTVANKAITLKFPVGGSIRRHRERGRAERVLSSRS